MRKMKDSGVEWIGEIPEDWEVSRLKFSAQIISGSTPNSNEPSFWNGDINWITPKDLNDNQIISSSFRTITKEGYLSCGTYLVQKNSVVLSTRAPIGAVGITGKELCTNQGIKSILCKERELHYKYLYYYLLINDLVLNSLGNGTIFLELSTTSLENLEIPCPSFKDQCRVVEVLDEKNSSLDNIRGLLIDEIHTLEAYKKSVITEAVTKGLDRNAEMKDSGIEWIGEIPKHWDVRRLKQILSKGPNSLKVGPFGSAIKSTDFIDEGKWVYNQRSVLDNNFNINDTFISEEKYNELRSFRVYKGDVLLTTRGTIGRVAVVPQSFYEGVIHPCIIRFQLDGDVFRNELIKYIFNDTDIILRQLEFLSNSATIGVIYSYNLVNLYIPAPSIEEQYQILNYLDKKTKVIDEVIAIKQNQLSLLDEYKKSLIYEYVTGKREV